MTRRFLRSLLDEASRPFRGGGRMAHSFAYHYSRGKLSSESIFRELLKRGILLAGGRYLDLGCGQGGLFLTRVGDASAGLPYHLYNWVDHVVTFVRGHRLPRLYCRPLAEWVALLESFGFTAESDPMNDIKPFANVMLVCRLPA